VFVAVPVRTARCPCVHRRSAATDLSGVEIVVIDGGSRQERRRRRSTSRSSAASASNGGRERRGSASTALRCGGLNLSSSSTTTPRPPDDRCSSRVRTAARSSPSCAQAGPSREQRRLGRLARLHAHGAPESRTARTWTVGARRAGALVPIRVIGRPATSSGLRLRRRPVSRLARHGAPRDDNASVVIDWEPERLGPVGQPRRRLVEATAAIVLNVGPSLIDLCAEARPMEAEHLVILEP
jgi:hypothetical protein